MKLFDVYDTFYTPGEGIKVNTRLRRTADLFTEHLVDVTKDSSHWTSFLQCAGRMYKYSFVDQLLIHAQRPDAVACASMEFWNEKMHRWIKRGSKGIALIDRTNPHRPLIKYVFDIGDTHQSRANTPTPYIWKMGEEHIDPVKQMLSKTYGIDDADIKAQLLGIVRKLQSSSSE